MQESVWYRAVNKQKVGPIAFMDLQKMAASGQIQPADMLLEAGMPKWVRADSVANLFSIAEKIDVTIAPTASDLSSQTTLRSDNLDPSVQEMGMSVSDGPRQTHPSDVQFNSVEQSINSKIDKAAKKFGAEKWYYAKNGERFGPFNFEQFQQMALSGMLTPFDMLWNDEVTQWVSAGAVERLFPHVAVPIHSVSPPLRCDLQNALAEETATNAESHLTVDICDVNPCFTRVQIQPPEDKRHLSWQKLRTIARRQFYLHWIILLPILLEIAVITILYLAGNTILIEPFIAYSAFLGVPLVLASWIAAIRLAVSLGENPFLWGAWLLFPDSLFLASLFHDDVNIIIISMLGFKFAASLIRLINILVLLVLDQNARKILNNAGIRVGFLGRHLPAEPPLWFQSEEATPQALTSSRLIVTSSLPEQTACAKALPLQPVQLKVEDQNQTRQAKIKVSNSNKVVIAKFRPLRLLVRGLFLFFISIFLLILVCVFSIGIPLRDADESTRKVIEAESRLAEQKQQLKLQSIQNPTGALAYNNRGNVYFDKKEYDKAIEEFSEAIRLNPRDDFFFFNRGNAYFSQKKFNKAIADYTSAINLNSSFTNAFYNRGLAFRNDNEFGKALQDYTKVINLDPKHALAYINRGNLYFDTNKYDEAIADYTKTINLNGGDDLVYFNRGMVYNRKKEYEKALDDFSESIRCNSGNASVYDSYAWLLATCPKESVRNGKMAVDYAIKACEISAWKHALHLETLAAAHAECGDFKSAVSRELEAIQIGSNDKNARVRLSLYQDSLPYREE